ncbi:MAG: hypothetical protein LBM65_06630 [Oscillospiraceae bacterium]|jgi:peptidoglycan hydrolase CwlO-like protein|nr:hypothetical protein [Oscillospiraceae bacterium]
MQAEIIVAIITSTASFFGVIITAFVSGRRQKSQHETQSSWLKTKFDYIEKEIAKLEDKVGQHNHFNDRLHKLSARIDLQEKDIKSAEHRIDDLEEN